MPVMTRSSLHAWWSDLRHNGLVVAPALLEEFFPKGPIEPSFYRYQRLRERYTAFDTWYRSARAYEQDASYKPLNDWLESVLDIFLGHENWHWQRGNHVDTRWKYETILHKRLIPQRVFFSDQAQTKPAFFVMIDHNRELGRGRSRTVYADLLQLLRAKGVKLGLLTNGRQFRLCYAGIDYDSWVEWDCESWFSEEELRRQLYGFYTLLGPVGMTSSSTDISKFPLLEAAEASRTRQGELSLVLGEQVRQSVETLLNDFNQSIHTYDITDEQGITHNPLFDTVRYTPGGMVLSERRMLDALYQASVRIIMRMVIILFAEARDLLPRSLPNYNTSYSLEGLYEQLRRAEQQLGRTFLEERDSAWVRLLSLFTLVYEGTESPDLAVRAYGGMLFRAGQADSPDAILRAVSLFESMKVSIADATVLKLLDLLKIGKVKIRQGRSTRTMPGPVDFSELRTEYIGLMYQGLLDFNLHNTSETMVFLKMGQQPILPLSTLQNMGDKDLKEFLSKVQAEKSTGPVSSEDEAEEDNETGDLAGRSDLLDDAEDEETEEVANGTEDIEDDSNDSTDLSNATITTEEEQRSQDVLQWATYAVEVVGLVKKPKGKQQGEQYRYEKEKQKAARSIIERVFGPNEFYLTRRGGTRKGSGTFYTRPQLAVPIARNTLKPLLYETNKNGEDGTALPKKPEEILLVRVCDPACGSASFLVAALHYITDALYESLVYHQRIRDYSSEETYLDIKPLVLPTGTPSRAYVKEYLLPVPPTHERFEPLVKAYLRRFVVERCIYGVDLSPLAVELARMSLWIETMDRNLPFTFLDHKIKVGNALIGAWFDTFREYPIMSWEREGGDTGHTNGVHYQAKAWTKALSEQENNQIKLELIEQIRAAQPQLFPSSQQTPEGVHDEAFHELDAIHNLSADDVEEREQRYNSLQAKETYQELKYSLDRWCASWFWPADELDAVPTPATFYQTSPRTQEIVDDLVARYHFFHWELEFPDVFDRVNSGFDVILANPPWEIAKPSSKEFFGDYDPLYRGYGKQEALQKQRDMFQQQLIEREWLLYQAYFKSMSNWARHAASPFGDPTIVGKEKFILKSGKQNDYLHEVWRNRRAEYMHFAAKDNPFYYQGSADLNTYKMFLEVSHHLLNVHGRMGILVPSGIYTDKGSKALRRLFLDSCRWEWIFCFINKERIFEIDSQLKFAVVLLEKERKTKILKVAYNRKNLSDLEQPNKFMLDFPSEQIEHFSPKSLAVVELQTQRDFAILNKLYSNTVLFGEQHAYSWQIDYSAEFHMTNDSKLFLSLAEQEARGYQHDGYGRWVNSEGKIALPLYEGRMIGAFDPSKKGWRSGKGPMAKWDEIPFDRKEIEPQYLVLLDNYTRHSKAIRGNKICFMRIGKAINARSMYTAFVGDMPCGEAVPALQTAKSDVINLLCLASCLNSFVYDYALRCRLGGMNISLFILEETPLVPPSRLLPTICAKLAASLNFIMLNFAQQWLELKTVYPELSKQHWRQLWAITPHERLRLRCILDAIIAELYGLEYDDLVWILREKQEDQSNSKGFWRGDEDKPHALRQTTLTLAAFKRLKEVGLTEFSQEDWQFSSDIGEQLGPRFTPWQEQGSIVESWEECEMHAQRMKETPIPLPASAVTTTLHETTQNNITVDGQHIQNTSKKKHNKVQSQVDLWSLEDEG